MNAELGDGRVNESLTTFAPAVDDRRRLLPTGNLVVSLPEIDEHGRCHSLGVLRESHRGLVAAQGAHDVALIEPRVRVDGAAVALDALSWRRAGDWVPIGTMPVLAGGAGASGRVEVGYLAPVDRHGTSEHGVIAWVEYTNRSDEEQQVELDIVGAWDRTLLHHFKPKELDVPLRVRDEPWTGTRGVYAAGETFPLALSWRPGPGCSLGGGARGADGAAEGKPTGDGTRDEVGAAGDLDATWRCSRTAVLAPGRTVRAEALVGVAVEPDAAAGTALHLRRRGAQELTRETLAWLAAHRLVTGDPDVDERLNLNLFFAWFYAQGDCLDTGRPVLLTSRSPRYYVCAAFWSRDAYWWTFPALLLVDAGRARQVLLASLAAAGPRIAHHALFITGERLYPGFELDELVAPVFALWRYVTATGDRDILGEAPVRELAAHVLAELEQWRGANGLFATFLLPTDDPVTHPYVATDNAMVAMALEALAELAPPGIDPQRCARRATALRAVVVATFRRPLPARAAGFRADADDLPSEDARTRERWVWAVDEAGAPEVREEPPLSLRTLPYWGVCSADEPAYLETMAWLVGDYEYHCPGAFPGAGAPHFTSPSSFDLANRMLSGNHDLGDPLQQFAATPMDGGLACESWDPDTGEVATGAAMASVAGFLAWTAWAAHTGHSHWKSTLRADATQTPLESTHEPQDREPTHEPQDREPTHEPQDRG